MKSSKRHRVMVSCPFCSALVESRELAEHAKSAHSRENDNVQRANRVPVTPMDGIVVKNPDLIREIKRHVIDESGVLIRPGLLGVNDQRKTRDERLGGVRLPQRRKAKKAKHQHRSAIAADREGIGGPDAAPQGGTSSKANDEAHRSKVEWLDNLRRQASDRNAAIEPGLQPCPVCGVKVKTTRLRSHLAKVHESAGKPQTKPVKSSPPALPLQRLDLEPSSIRNAPSKLNQHPAGATQPIGSSDAGMTSCPHCTVRVKSTRLGKHIAKVHYLLNRDTPSIQTPSRPGKAPAGKTQPKVPAKAERRWKPEQTDDLETFRQSFAEPRDGSKGLGHMRREGDGKFGSFPLHDDYGDEAGGE